MDLSELINQLKLFSEAPHDEIEVHFTNEEGYKLKLESLNKIERINLDFDNEFDNTTYYIEFNVGVRQPGR